MARLELAKLDDLKGNRKEALAGYRALLSDPEKMTPKFGRWMGSTATKQTGSRARSSSR